MDGHESKGDVSETVNPFPDGHQHGQPLPRSSRHQPARVEVSTDIYNQTHQRLTEISADLQSRPDILLCSRLLVELGGGGAVRRFTIII